MTIDKRQLSPGHHETGCRCDYCDGVRAWVVYGLDISEFRSARDACMDPMDYWLATRTPEKWTPARRQRFTVAIFKHKLQRNYACIAGSKRRTPCRVNDVISYATYRRFAIRHGVLPVSLLVNKYQKGSAP